MLSSPVNFGSSVNRKVEVVAGVLLAVVGVPFFVVGGTALWAIIMGKLEDALYAFTILGIAIGAFCLWTGARMIFGLKRSDGGLLSPFVLRLAALFFAVGPIVLLVTSDRLSLWSLWRVLELALFFAAAGACLVLANRRQHQTLGQDSVESDV
jgi:hypothetical protein